MQTRESTPAAASLLEGPADASGSLPKVLVVEDDPCLAFLYGKMIGAAGYIVTHCADGEAALAALSREKFDAVVLDLMLPKVDGMQVLKEMRGSFDTALTPVIVLTAARLKLVEEQALRYRVKLYLEKTQHQALMAGLRKIMAERGDDAAPRLRMAPPSPIVRAKLTR